MANVKAELRAASDAVCAAIVAGDAAKAASMFTDDHVVHIEDGDTHKGQDGFMESLNAVISAGVAKIVCDEACFEAGPLGDGFGYQLGQWDSFNKDGAKLFTFKDLVIWKKVDGNWKGFREMRIKL